MQHLGASYGFSVGVLISISVSFVGISRPIYCKKLDGAVVHRFFLKVRLGWVRYQQLNF